MTKPVDPETQDEKYDFHNVHEAAKDLDIDKLKKILKQNKHLSNAINSNNGCTPLHSAMQSENFNKNLDEVHKTIKVLLKFGADINIPNKKSPKDTPFTLLVVNSMTDKEKGKDILNYVNKVSLFIDINSCRSDELKQMLNKIVPNVYDFLNIEKFKSSSQKDIEEELLALVDKDSRKKLMQVLSTLDKDPKFRDNVNAIINSGRVLRKAVILGLTDVTKALVKLGANPFKKPTIVVQTQKQATGCDKDQHDDDENEHRPMLTEKEKNKKDEEEEDDEEEKDADLPVIYTVCKYGRDIILANFLKNYSILELNNKKQPLLHYTVNNYKSPNFYKLGSNHYRTFDLLINHPNIDVNELDGENNTALQLASNTRNEDCMKKLLHKKHVFIGRSHQQQKSPIEAIPPHVLENYFNSCITASTENTGDINYKLTFNYTCMVDPKGKNDINSKVKFLIIQDLASLKPYSHLVLHPLLTSILFLKWSRLSKFFYANLAAYVINCIPIISFIVLCYNHGDDSIGCHSCYILKCWAYVSLVYLIIRETVQFVFETRNYFFIIANYLELSLIVLVWLVLFGEEYFTDDYCRVIGGVTILWTTTEMTHLIAMPIFSLSTDMAMLKQVSMTFIRIFALYAVVLLAFALSFYSMIGSYGEKRLNDTEGQQLDQFRNIRLSIVKTIVMFTGEYDANQIDFYGNMGSYVVFIIFIFFISIVMMNLLMGLAVSDTQKIKNDAYATYWTERAKLLARYEKGILTWVSKMDVLINIFPIHLHENKINIKINSEPENEIVQWTEPQESPTNKICKKSIDDPAKKKVSGLVVFSLSDQSIWHRRKSPIGLFMDNEIIKKAKAVIFAYKDRMTDVICKQKTHQEIKTSHLNAKKARAFKLNLNKIGLFEKNMEEIKELLRNVSEKRTAKVNNDKI